MRELSYNRLVGFLPVLSIGVIYDPKVITTVLRIVNISAYPDPIASLDVYNLTHAQMYVAGIVICFSSGVVNLYDILKLLYLYGRFCDIVTLMLLGKQFFVVICPLDKSHQT